jgi:hypothetical protein
VEATPQEEEEVILQEEEAIRQEEEEAIPQEEEATDRNLHPTSTRMS